MNMTRVSAKKIFKDQGIVLNKIVQGGDRIILQEGKKNVAAIIPMNDYTLLKEIEDHLELIKKVKQEIKKKGVIPWEQVKKELHL